MTDFVQQNANDRHQPVMLQEVLDALKPHDGGVFIDGTFGAGGYSRGLLEAAKCRVIAIDRDPNAIADGASMVAAFANRLQLIEGRFADMSSLIGDDINGKVAGVALDVGVSSMQLDEADRGFSFMRDGPLDMRMDQSGPTAADLVNELSEADLKKIIAVFGEERRAHAVARAIAQARSENAITRTGQLAALVENVLGRGGPKRHIHPATKTFQALRIYLNDELTQLAVGLKAAEDLLAPGGRLAVVSFHSLEDRIVKQFFKGRCGGEGRPSRHLPDQPQLSASFMAAKKQSASAAEIANNPRARSARLRFGERTAAPAHPFDLARYGAAGLVLQGYS